MADTPVPEAKPEKKTAQEILDLQALKKGVDKVKARKKYTDKHGADSLKAEVNTKKEQDELKVKMEAEIDEELARKDQNGVPYVENLKVKSKVETEIKKLKGIEKVINQIETLNDIRNLDAKMLIELENKYPGILMYSFTDRADEVSKKDYEKIDLSKWTDYTNPNPGTKLKVNFHGNAFAENDIGAADLLPPTIRKVTVYSENDPVNKRTSERRIGLKGENKKGRGFFDQEGYIAIYSGDIVIIGGEKEPEKGVEMDFMKKYLEKSDAPKSDDPEKQHSEAEKQYAIAQGKGDEDWLAMLEKKNPHYRRQKRMSDDEIAALTEHVESTGAGKKVVEAIATSIKSGYRTPPYDKRPGGIKGCCFYWVDHIYQEAGVKRNMIYNSVSQYSGRDCGDKHADKFRLDQIKPGDHIYYNQEREYIQEHRTNKKGEQLHAVDDNGNHSAIFIGWIGPQENHIAQMASSSAGMLGRFHKNPVDFNKMPVTRIYKPVFKRGSGNGEVV
ncbi:MAG: hypothetical protein NTX63_00750 [Candidatus Peregrinibacteria bacterium]|nr:hypothetical protein [Candidatus Peregrinibacteria bacterium]